MATVVQTFVVTAANSVGYQIDGVTNAPLTLTRGYTYAFKINASGHPLWMQRTGNAYNISNLWTLGVSNNGAQIGTIIFTVPTSAPDTLYYQCQYHPLMYGVMTIIDPVNGQAFTTLDPNSDTIEDVIDKVFYGVKQNILTGQAYIDTIAGDGTITLPDQYVRTGTDYVNWMWSYNRFLYSFDPTTGHLLMEVL